MVIKAAAARIHKRGDARLVEEVLALHHGLHIVAGLQRLQANCTLGMGREGLRVERLPTPRGPGFGASLWAPLRLRPNSAKPAAVHLCCRCRAPCGTQWSPRRRCRLARDSAELARAARGRRPMEQLHFTRWAKHVLAFGRRLAGDHHRLPEGTVVPHRLHSGMGPVRRQVPALKAWRSACGSAPELLWRHPQSAASASSRARTDRRPTAATGNRGAPNAWRTTGRNRRREADGIGPLVDHRQV
mmetsp:Transcript_97247/g.208621  ORF Transcript_97247/g.208621 Transcript_97247/m.208621 type:complete len:244 (+) Transcript_97247:232-963(+)